MLPVVKIPRITIRVSAKVHWCFWTACHFARIMDWRCLFVTTNMNAAKDEREDLFNQRSTNNPQCPFGQPVSGAGKQMWNRFCFARRVCNTSVQSSRLWRFCDFCLSRFGRLFWRVMQHIRDLRQIWISNPLQNSQIFSKFLTNVVIVVLLLSRKAFRMIWAYTLGYIPSFHFFIASPMRTNDQFFHPRFAFRFQRDGSNAWDSVRGWPCLRIRLWVRATFSYGFCQADSTTGSCAGVARLGLP